jgi:uncharacterized protein with NRDE domain
MMYHERRDCHALLKTANRRNRLAPMCLVFISFQTCPKSPVMIGANREEQFRRPRTSPVCCRSGSRRCLLAGADFGLDGSFPEMGTWLGVNDAGLVVAVTNRRDGELPFAEQYRSRGLLAVELLRYDDPERAASAARSQLEGGGFGGSNFLIANSSSAWVVQAPGASRVSIVTLEPGTHAITNADVDDNDDSRIRLVRSELRHDNFRNSAADLCRDPRIMIAAVDRGTVSSSLIFTGDDVALFHIFGDPSGRDYEEYRLLDPPTAKALCRKHVASWGAGVSPAGAGRAGETPAPQD